MHLLILVIFFFGIFIGIPWMAYRHGKKVGDATGYMRGYKEGQQSTK